jgi:hypothetical protein
VPKAVSTAVVPATTAALTTELAILSIPLWFYALNSFKLLS